MECQVGVPDEGVGVRDALIRDGDGDADAERDLESVATDDHGLTDLCQQPASELDGIELVFDRFGDHEEFIATHMHDRVTGTQAPP